ncbi:S41 family peptidase [Corynebacterium minutissimum]|uniref:S41 family peptidase n=1 Tax=Corynebacterium minutissimum TaxID=38301 RepID=UPI001EF31786|nr:S41 family peptidase [Corynebacterium minutissimum]MCG7230530.1 S41 family peptidase [Corynebacterium minutissimum]MCG7239685.1 S41 family peptidase [Corynebacterium minutissimum]
MKTVLKIFGGLFIVALIVVLAAVYFFGPSYGGALLGKPVFLFNASEKRINTAMVDTAALTGIYGESEEFQRAREAFKEDPTNAELLDAAIDAAGGKHSKVFSTEKEKTIDNTDPSVEFEDGVLRATVPSIGRHDDGQVYADTLATGLTAHPEACAAVVDLRGNDGGDMGPMYAGLSPLLPDGTALSFVSRMGTTDVVIDGNSVTGGGTPTTTSGGKLEVPVAVLTDDETASSAEATLLAFRGLDNVRTFGEPTAGYASANMVIDYPDGRSLMITTAKDKARTGEEFAEDPIAPDAPESELDSWLASRCG